MNVKIRLRLVLSLFSALSISGCELLAPDPAPDIITTNYILHCKTISCSQLQPVLQNNKARVTHHFDNFPLLAITIPAGSTQKLRKDLAGNPLYKDKPLKSPEPVKNRAPVNAMTNNSIWVDRLKLDNNEIRLNKIMLGGSLTVRATDSIQALDDDDDDDREFNRLDSFNLTGTGIDILHQRGARGQNVIVAVIDSGVANDASVVPVLEGSVIGGENFVPDEGEPSATSILNAEHGTWVGHLIAGHGDLVLPAGSPIATTFALYRPDAITLLANGDWQVSMQGMAPEASIYAMKTFPANGAGAPSSRVIAAMDRVLSLKMNFNDGLEPVPVAGDGSAENPFVYDALNIQVVNLSLGGSTLYAGREVDEILTEALLNAGVLVVTSAGNEGFAALTTGAPGSGLGSLNVGATSIGANEQVFRELQNGLGMGSLFRPRNDLQIAHFSSRGPTADGRQSVHVMANGVATFVQGADGHLSMVSGTSFSAPIVAGAAAALISAIPEANAAAVRDAIAGAANDDVLQNVNPIDQGFGILDTARALGKLRLKPVISESSRFPDEIEAAAGSRITDILRQQGYMIADATPHSFSARLTPGMVSQYWLEIPADTSAVIVSVESVEPELPTELQNSLFGDDAILEVLDGPTSVDHLVARAFINQPEPFFIPDPIPGVMRVALMGDWTNIGDVEVELTIEILPGEAMPASYSALISGQEAHSFEFDVTAGTDSIALQLAWLNGWNSYPAHDLDLILISPSGQVNLDAATWHAPEYVELNTPEPGTWLVIVEGFSLHGGTEQYELLLANAILRPLDAPPDLLPPP